MSAIAGVLLDMGCLVSGSDIKESRYTKVLAKKGAKIFIGHDKKNISNQDTVVYSSAINAGNPEMKIALESGLSINKRAEILGMIANDMNFVAVAGTHGKTTTTSMISFILEKNDVDPTYLIGAELNEIGSNSRYGESGICVAEADESDGSLIYMKPKVAVVTNIEADHLENHGSLEVIEELFTDFLKAVPDNGCSVVCGDYENIRKATKDTSSKKIFYGIDPRNDITGDSIEFHNLNTSYRILIKGQEAGKVRLKVPGMHNIANSLAAIAVCLELGLELEKIINALAKFRGVKRRFEIIGQANGVTVVDDYAHHPSEVKATLKAARNGEWKRIVAVFQPHRYSRTKHLHHEFSNAFEEANSVVLTDVYGAGEQPIPGITGKTIVDSLLNYNARKEVVYLPHKVELGKYLKSKLSEGDLLLVMGAGDISSLCGEIIRELDRPA